jgi:hypothetical protein
LGRPPIRRRMLDKGEACLAPTTERLCEAVPPPLRQSEAHACGCVTIGVWVEAWAASLISVPPWPSLAPTKLEAM